MIRHYAACAARAALALVLFVSIGCSEEPAEPRTPRFAPTALTVMIEDAGPLAYTRVGEENDESEIDFPESSGLTFHPTRKTLFTVSDDGHVGEFETDGTLVQRRHLLYEDFEGITADPASGLLYVVIEGRDNILEIDPNGLVIRREYDLARSFEGRKLYQLAGDGLEGIAFVPDDSHPEGGTLFVVNRSPKAKDLDDPPLLLEFELPLSSNSNDELEGAILSATRLAVTHLSGLHYDPRADRLLAVSDDNKIMIELTRQGELTNASKLPAEDPEGIAIDDDGVLYIAQDSEGIIKFQPGEATGN